MSDNDKKFLDTFMLVIGALVFITLIMFFLARYLSDETEGQWTKENPYAKAAVDERLKPVGHVVKDGETQPEVAAPAAAQAEPVVRSGADVFNEVCSVCHVAGVAGAPKVGDKAAWAGRISKGVDTLVKHATGGFQGTSGYMPPKGGRADLSDADIAAAVNYMVDQSK